MPIPGLDAAQAAANSAGMTLLSMLQNLESSYPGLYGLLWTITFITGVILVVSSLLMARKFGGGGGGQQVQVGYTLSTFLVGIALVNTPGMISTFEATVFDRVSHPLSYECALPRLNLKGKPGACTQQLSAGVSGRLRPVFLFVQFVGVVAFIRGWLMMRKVGHEGQPDVHPFYRGAIFIGFGVLCIHVVDTLRVAGETFGLSFLTRLVAGL